MSFAPVWISTAPQEVLEFMAEESETVVVTRSPLEL